MSKSVFELVSEVCDGFKADTGRSPVKSDVIREFLSRGIDKEETGAAFDSWRKTDSLTFNQRVADAGITIIRTGERDRMGREIIYLERDGKRIRRPNVDDVVEVCRETFGVEI